METILFVIFESGKGTIHDRIQYFEEKKTLKYFMEWMAEKREEIEKKYGPVCVVNMKIKVSN